MTRREDQSEIHPETGLRDDPTAPSPALNERIWSESGQEAGPSLGAALRLERRSDLLRPEYRGPIAEAIVGHATNGTRDEGWGYDTRGVRAPDVLTPDDLSIEVKSSGELGPRGPIVKPAFHVPKKSPFDVLVLAYLTGGDPMHLESWEFYVLSPNQVRAGQTLTLTKVRELTDVVSYEDLLAAIHSAGS